MTPRVVLACWPFEGHIFPQVSMAIALRERGAEVAFYTDESRRELIEDLGFELLPFRRVTRTWERVHGRDRGTGGRRHMLQLMREARAWMVDSIPDQVADLQDIVATWRPDVIGAEASMWGALLVLSELGPVPVGLVSPLISAPMPEAADSPTGRMAAGTRRLVTTPLRRRLDAIRARHGLGPMGCSVSEYFGRLPLCLVLSVPELDGERTDLPAHVSYVGACQWHPPDSPGTTEWLDRLPGDRPWVHVTEGTSRFAESSLLRVAAEGLADAPMEVLITTGREPGAQGAGTPPRARNIHVAKWLSHDVLLPRCAAIVTTGGMGTVIAALRSGVPLVVVPTGWDKPANARRVVAAGVGVQLSPRRCTAETLRAAVDEVLGNPRYRRGAQRAAELLAGAPGPAGAADLIAGLADGTPTAGTAATSVGRAGA
jgi:MGT family glycosyltransferase